MIGFTTALNEAECIEGWIRQVQRLCDRVVVLIDPKTTDDTKAICESLGVETRPQVQGVQEPLTNWHYNQNQFIEKEIANGEWFVFYDADERLEPQDLETFAQAFETHKDEDYESFCVRDKVEYYPDEHHITIWSVPYILQQPLIMKKTPVLYRGLVHHTPFNIDPYKKYVVPVIFHHYTKVKTLKPPFQHRDNLPNSAYVILRQQNNGGLKFSEYENPIPNWRTMT